MKAKEELEELGYSLTAEYEQAANQGDAHVRLTATKKYVAVVAIDAELFRGTASMRETGDLGIRGLIVKIKGVTI